MNAGIQSLLQADVCLDDWLKYREHSKFYA